MKYELHTKTIAVKIVHYIIKKNIKNIKYQQKWRYFI